MNSQGFTEHNFLKIASKVKPIIEYKFGNKTIRFKVIYNSVVDISQFFLFVSVDFKRISGTKKVKIKGNVMCECMSNEFKSVTKFIGMEDTQISFKCDTEKFY